MATNFPQALAPQYAAPQYVDPYEAQLQALRQKLAQPDAPMFTPEQIAQRRAENQQQYALGILGQLSGDEGLSGVGGQVLRQALAARQPKITERGAADQLTGQFAYSPDYLRSKDEAQLNAVESRSAAQRANWDSARVSAQERQELAKQRAHEQELLRQFMVSNRPEPLVPVIGPNGEAVLLPRSQATGMKPAAPGGGGQPTGDERNAAGYAARMQSAEGVIADAGGKGGNQTALTKGAGMVPVIGQVLQTTLGTLQQNRMRQAADDWIRAKLRKESGAAIGKDEMASEYVTYFPQPNDPPEVVQQKAQARAIASAAMRESAGRAGNTVDAIAATGGREAPAAAGGTGALSPQEAAELAALRKRFGKSP